MLTQIFNTFFGVSISLTPMILLFLLGEKKVSRRYSPKLLLGVWGAFVARLLIPIQLISIPPFLISAGNPLYYLDNERSAIARAFAEAPAPSAIGTVGNVVVTQAGEATISWISIAAMVWALGVLCLLFYGLLKYTLQWKKLKRWSHPLPHQLYKEILDQCRADLKIKREITVVRSSLVTTPVLIGLFSPRIILPEGDIPADTLTSVLTHELCHYQRRDIWKKFFVLLATSLYWFHPLVHLMSRRVDQQIELCCDYDVLEQAGGLSSKDYGLSILHFTGENTSKALVLSTAFMSNRRQTKERFMQIIHHAPKKKGLLVLLVSLAVIFISGALVGCETQPSLTEQLPPAIEELQILPIEEENAVEVEEAESGINPDDQESSTTFAERQRQAVAKEHSVVGVLATYETIETEPPTVYGWPVPGEYTIGSAYGWRHAGQDYHTGIDVISESIKGKPVVASAAGKVFFVNKEVTEGAGYGKMIMIDHGGTIATLYGHLDTIGVSMGDKVEAGDQIGTVGSTGYASVPQLHFEVREDGKPADPQQYLMDER